MPIKTPAQFVLFIASTTLDVTNFRRLARLAALDCLAAVRLYTHHGSEAAFRAAAQQIGIKHQLTVHAPLRPVSMGALVHAALDLGHMASAPDHAPHTVVVISNQRAVQTIVDWGAASQCDWMFFPALSESTVDSLLHRITSHYDQGAIDIYKDLLKHYPRKAMPISVWADAMKARFPELRDPSQRSARLGRQKFIQYFALLGIPQLAQDAMLPPRPLQLRPRPTLDDLYQVYVELHRKEHPPYFLHWCNTVLAKWPAMQRPDVRRWLFGHAGMEKIALQVDLIPKNLRLIPRIDTHVNEFARNAHHGH